jgi:hypothetical protein
MVWQHYPSRAYSNGRSTSGDKAYQYRGSSTGYAFDIVMLGQPVAFVSPPLYMPGQIQTVLHGLAWGAIDIHHYQIKNRQRNAQFFFRMLHPGSYQSDAFILQQMLL